MPAKGKNTQHSDTDSGSSSRRGDSTSSNAAANARNESTSRLGGRETPPLPIARSLSYCHLDPALWKDLPKETQLEVLAKLPAAELLDFTASGSHFNEVINANEAALATRIVKHKRQELIAKMGSMDYTGHRSLFDALKHWISHKGVYTVCILGQTADFAYHWLDVCGGYEGDFSTLHKYVQTLVNQYKSPEETKYKFFIDPSTFKPLTHSEAVIIASRFNLPGGLKANQKSAPNDMERANVGQLFNNRRPSAFFKNHVALTSVYWEYESICDERDGFIREAAFLQEFKLPRPAPSGFGENRGARVAYCVLEKDIPNIKEAFASPSTMEEIRPLERARILESVFVW